MVYFWEIIPNPITTPCQNCGTCESAKPGKYYKKNTKKSKAPLVSIAVSSVTQRYHLGIHILENTFGSSIQARGIPPPSWGSASPISKGSLLSLKWASPPSTVQKRSLNTPIIIVLWYRGRKMFPVYELLYILNNN